MSDRYRTVSLRALAIAASLAGGVAAVASASAQEAITLEVIGAVRMARPDEAGMAAGREGARSPAQTQPRHGERITTAH